jgi:L-lactate dehydrogenase (cytochrome)
MLNYHDFESAAHATFPAKTWAFYSSAATDLVTHKLNHDIYDRILLRPRVLRDVVTISTGTTILGQPSSFPIFAAPAALAMIAHPDGELAIARACAKAGIPQCISTNSSYPVQDIFESVEELQAAAARNGGIPPTFFFQLYVDKDRKKSEVLIREIERLGAKGIFLTVDAAVPGKRELDERVKAESTIIAPMSSTQAASEGGIAKTMSGFIDPGLSWKDIAWLKSVTDLPIVLKGVMSAGDAKLAAQHGCAGVVLSNHGGRNLDTSPPAIITLLEIHRRCPEILDTLEIIVDGGIKRGTDIFKALCLGASSVGVGRGFLFSLAYGEAGCERWIGILRDEFETTMRLMGVTAVEELGPHLVHTGAVDELVPTAEEHPYVRWRRGVKAKL